MPLFSNSNNYFSDERELTCIQKASVSDFSQNIDNPDCFRNFIQYFQTNATLSHGSFLPYPYQFNIQCYPNIQRE
jgi:hypothetical protein